MSLPEIPGGDELDDLNAIRKSPTAFRLRAHFRPIVEAAKARPRPSPEEVQRQIDGMTEARKRL